MEMDEKKIVAYICDTSSNAEGILWDIAKNDRQRESIASKKSELNSKCENHDDATILKADGGKRQLERVPGMEREREGIYYKHVHRNTIYDLHRPCPYMAHVYINLWGEASKL
jgi:hypothetical protein